MALFLYYREHLCSIILAFKQSSQPEETFNPKYLKRRRMQVKAPLAVFFALAWPDRAFADAKDMLQAVRWNEYAEIQTAFRELDIFGE